MAGCGRHLIIIACFMVLSQVYGQNAESNQCDLSTSWEGTWVQKFNGANVVLTYFNDSTRLSDLQSSNAGRTIDFGNGEVESFCEAAETFATVEYNTYDEMEEGETIEQNSVVAYKVLADGPSRRYCVDGIPRQEILLIRDTTEALRRNGYTVEQCLGILGSPTVWKSLVKWNLDESTGQLTFPDAMNVIDDGTYYFAFKNGDDVETCTPGPDSSIEITSAWLDVKSCENTNTYKRPLQSQLVIAGVVTDEELDIAETNILFGGMVTLGFADSSSPVGYYFYIARFIVPKDNGRLEIMFTTDNMEDPSGYASINYIDASVRSTDTMFFYIYSRECESDPCQNNGTCVQEWSTYSCMCVDGYSGMNCEDDTDDCANTFSPCNDNGQCVDGLGTFSCICDPNWGGQYCDELDSCNPNRCKNGGTCINDAFDYYCQCPIEYYGNNCQYEDYCLQPDACANGGTCFYLGGVDDYFCDCSFEWSGKYCEIPIDQVTRPPISGTICEEDEDCSNSGLCVDSRCQCTVLWIGPRCEILNPWFVASIALICFLALLLIIILIVCCCCCYGVNSNGNDNQRQYTEYYDKSMDGLSQVGPAPGSVSFNVRPAQSATFNDVLTSSR